MGKLWAAPLCAVAVASVLSPTPAPAGVEASGNLRVSVTAGGGQARMPSDVPVVTADGTVVAFATAQPRMVRGDRGRDRDVFVRDLSAGTLVRASVDAGGGEADGESTLPDVSADGRYVAFHSAGTDLVAGDTNQRLDVFVRDLDLGTTALASVDTSGGPANGDSVEPTISADGRYVAFSSWAGDLVPGDTRARDVFVRDMVAGTTARVTVTHRGGQPNGDSLFPAISADGRHVAFSSRATNLTPDPTGIVEDVFVRDLVAGTTVLVSRTLGGGDPNLGACWVPDLSADGRYVTFETQSSNLVAGDDNLWSDVFLADMATGDLSIVTRDSAGGPANGPSYRPSITPDGRYVAFSSDADDLVAGDPVGGQVFVRDLVAGTTARATHDVDGGAPNGRSFDAAISADGAALAFVSRASDLVPGDTNGVWDVFWQPLG